ncbi:GTP cyclohydrolase I FolE [Candidatus Desantisbacteria bacterium]|nr:GTP cyclohydrolase I FolE [Candidatus Desantisbacteria bacterium]
MDTAKIETAIRMLLEGIGEDPLRPGLLDTPKRVAKMYEDILSGMTVDAVQEMLPFLSDEYDEMVIARDITFHSICEHHLVPFFGKAHIAYIPNKGRMIGLSKLSRIVDIFSRRMQVQERLVSEIADLLMETLKPQGVLVVMEAEHLCMTMRGVKKPGSSIVTSAVRGVFNNKATRSEALSLIRGGK